MTRDALRKQVVYLLSSWRLNGPSGFSIQSTAWTCGGVVFLHRPPRCLYSTRGLTGYYYIFTGRPAGRTGGRTVGRSVGQSVGRTIGRTVARMVGLSDGRSDDRSESRMVGRLIGRSDARTNVRAVGRSGFRSVGEGFRSPGAPGAPRN